MEATLFSVIATFIYISNVACFLSGVFIFLSFLWENMSLGFAVLRTQFD